jgi:hypothetical protein
MLFKKDKEHALTVTMVTSTAHRVTPNAISHHLAGPHRTVLGGL